MHTVCVAWDSDLVNMLEAKPSLKACGLVYMQPGWASRSGNWESREIHTIWRTRDQDNDDVFIFVDVGGSEHFGSGRSRTVTGHRQLVIDFMPATKA